jgi:EAL domain-containing protein (putative c-di-GMP-specific phosphodiesterase class I)
MGGEKRDAPRSSTMLGEGSAGEELSRLAARAYRPTRVEIDEALRHNWLEIWYQPKIDLRHRSLVGAEALARIRHPELGILLPKSFLPAISDASLAHLTEHALRAALRSWSTFDQAGFNLHLAINVPIGALRRLPVADMVQEHRPEAAHWPGLIVEVKEEQAVADLESAQELARDLRGSGISMSMDDVGPGFAPFASLREGAFAELKLDVGVTRNCAIDAANAAICRNVIDCAHRIGSVAVAEGIESATDLQALQTMGCDLGQGVLIAPPLPETGFLDLLRQRLVRPVSPPAPTEATAPQAARPPGIDRVA